MDFTDTDLLACINSGHKTTSEIADEVGAKNTQQAAKALGVLKNQGLIAKNGQAQWFVIDDLATHEDMRTLYEVEVDFADVSSDSDALRDTLKAASLKEDDHLDYWNSSMWPSEIKVDFDGNLSCQEQELDEDISELEQAIENTKHIPDHVKFHPDNLDLEIAVLRKLSELFRNSISNQLDIIISRLVSIQHCVEVEGKLNEQG